MIDLGWPALALAVVPLGGTALEWVLLRWRWMPYFAAGFPLNLELVPIPVPPKGSGTTASVCWVADDEGLVAWWANSSRDGLTGLHGVVRCYRARGRVGLALRWSPPWSPLLVAVLLSGLGAFRGLPHVTIPVSALMVMGLMFVYHQAALRAAAELRWSFLNGGGDSEED